MLREGNGALYVSEGFRTRAEQQVFWAAFQAGGTKAARPGTSNHERGLAVDVKTAVPYFSVRAKLAKRWGLHAPVSGEAWHMELDPKRGAMPATIVPAVAPVRPPLSTTVLLTVELEDAMKLTTARIDNAPLDEGGNGWLLMDGSPGRPRVPFPAFQAVTPYGPAPQRDGYAWPNLYLSVNETDGLALIAIEGGPPNGAVSFVISYVQ